MTQEKGTFEDVWVTAALWCRDAAPSKGFLEIVGIMSTLPFERFPVGNADLIKICFCLEADRVVRLKNCSVVLYIPATGRVGHDEEFLTAVPDIEIDADAPAMRLIRVEPRRIVFTEPGLYVGELRSGTRPIARAFLRVEKLNLPPFR